MSKEAAAAILTQLYFQISDGLKITVHQQEKSESGDTQKLKPAQQQILKTYDEFFSHLSQGGWTAD
jgi:hypothetical protein